MAVDENLQSVVKCYDCGKSFFNESFFEAHVKRKHSKESRITNQDNKKAERVSNPVKSTTNVIGGTGNSKTDSSEMDAFDDVTNDELLAAVAQTLPAEPDLGGPNLYPKSKEDSVTGQKKNKVSILTIMAKTEIIYQKNMGA